MDGPNVIYRPPWFSGFEFEVILGGYTLDATGVSCSQIKYMCAEFSKGDNPQFNHGYQNVPFVVEGVESEIDHSPNPNHLTGCVPFSNECQNLCKCCKYTDE